MRDIKGYEGLYGITSCGRVYSYRAKRFLKPWKNNKGYLLAGLCKDGKKKHHLIHRLVAEAYLDNPENKPCISHLDENPLNNYVNNLSWATYEENNNYGTHNEKLSKALSKKIQCIETQEIF